MKVSHNWLQQYLKIDISLEKQLELLTDLGLEVEGTSPFESVKGSLKGVVVGEVISCEPHPNARFVHLFYEGKHMISELLPFCFYTSSLILGCHLDWFQQLESHYLL